ncbi:MAG: SprT family zinc-dependent metalloprotease [Desulfobaccales bacterium]
MKFDDLDIEYRLSPRRKSIGLMVTNEGRVVVSLPRGTSQESLALALSKHRAWIEAKVAERQAAWNRLKEGEAYFLGQPFRLTVLRGGQGAVTLNGKEIRVPLPEGADLWSRLVAWYAERAFRLLQERVSHFGTSMGLTPGPVTLKEWKRRWGECHPDGTLKFNWRLIMCPPEVIDYVIVHELAHLKVPGHNPRFWGQVAKVLPDYAARRRWLNRTGAPFLLWRP